MIEKPKNGVVHVSIGDFETWANYIFDIPFDWLKACIYALGKH